MTGIFKANNPSGNAFLFIYAIVLKVPMFLHVPMPQLQPLDDFFYKALLQVLAPVAKGFPAVYSIITFLLLFIQAISFNKIVNTQRLHRHTNYLTAMSYLLVTSLFSEWFSLSAPLIANTFLIWIWGSLCRLYNNPNAKAAIFNIGLATGLAAFIYFPSVIFLLIIMAGIALARPFRLQEWLIGLIGICTPIYFYAAFLFLSSQINSFHFPGFHLSYPHFIGNKFTYAALCLATISIGIGIYFININMRRQVVQTRKSWQLLFLYIFIAALVPFFNAGFNFSSGILLAVPLSPIIAAAFFYPQKNIVPQALHWAMVALILGSVFFK